MLASDVATPVGTDVELADVALKTLQRSEQPLTVAQVRSQLSGPFRKRANGLEAVLENLVERGAAHRLPKYRRAYRYWDRDLESYARQVIVQTLSGRSLTRSELKTKLKTRLSGLPEPRQTAILKELVDAGQVRKLPRFLGSRSDRFATGGIDPSEYVRDALEKVANALSKAGVSRDEVLAAAGKVLGGAAQRADVAPREDAPAPLDVSRAEAPSGLERVLIERMVEIEPAAPRGAMVYVPELRRALDFQPMDGAAFDQAVWELVRQERIAVHKHGHPAALDPTERAALLADERGNYYHGLSLRAS